MPPRGSHKTTPGIISPSTESLPSNLPALRVRNPIRRLNNSTASAALTVHFNRALASSVDSIADSILSTSLPNSSNGSPVHQLGRNVINVNAPVQSVNIECSSSTFANILTINNSSQWTVMSATAAVASSVADETSPAQDKEQQTASSPALPLVNNPPTSPSDSGVQSLTLDQEGQLMSNSTLASDPNNLFGYDMGFDLVAAAYATLVAAGGIARYVKAGSIPSLAAGLTFGGILGIGAYLTSVNPSNYYLTYGTSAVLGGVMGHRFYKSGKFMPAGLITLLSVGMVARYTYIAINNALKKPHST